MRRLIASIALLALAVAPAACKSRVTERRVREINSGALMKRQVRSYHLVYSEHDGKVAYLKVYAVQEAGGPIYDWSYVYDLDWKELGFVDQFGKAYRYHYYPEIGQEAHKKVLRYDPMPSDSLERNVMRMLEINPALDNVSFPTATGADVSGK